MLCRRTFIAQAIAGGAAMSSIGPSALAAAQHPRQKWYEAALEMRRLDAGPPAAARAP